MNFFKPNRYFIVYCFIVLSYSSYAQKVISVGIQLSPGLTSVNSILPAELKGGSTKGGFTFDFEFTGKYFLDKTYGFSSGIGLKNLKQSYSGTEYYTGFDAIDTENQSYERRVWGTNITETSYVSMIHIPLHFFYWKTINRNVAVFGSAGPGFSIPIVKKYTGKGTFTYKGYYSDYKVLLYDIPEYGFTSEVPVNTEVKLKTPAIVVDFGINAGVAFTISRYYKFVSSIGFIRTLNGVGKRSDNYHISDEVGSFNSFLYHNKSNLSNLSFSIGIQKDILF